MVRYPPGPRAGWLARTWPTWPLSWAGYGPRLRSRGHLPRDTAHRVASGGSAVDPAVIAEFVRARRRDDRLTRLTDREREALGLIAEGHSNRAIAERLGITTKTLEGMSGTIFGKLGLEDDPDVNRRVLAVLLYLDGAGA
jgi:DNA-binding NarL/FixJ family response regulator